MVPGKVDVMKKISVCPVCGSEAKLVKAYNRDEYHVCCSGSSACHLISGYPKSKSKAMWFSSQEIAIDYWNERAGVEKKYYEGSRTLKTGISLTEALDILNLPSSAKADLVGSKTYFLNALRSKRFGYYDAMNGSLVVY